MNVDNGGWFRGVSASLPVGGNGSTALLIGLTTAGNLA